MSAQICVSLEKGSLEAVVNKDETELRGAPYTVQEIEGYHLCKQTSCVLQYAIRMAIFICARS